MTRRKHFSQPITILIAITRQLSGAVITGPAAEEFSDMTDGAAAVIPEILAGQILSLARRGDRGAGHTVLAGSRDDNLSRDRLVVLLKPILTDGNDSDDSDDSNDGSSGDGDGGQDDDQGFVTEAAEQAAGVRQRWQAKTKVVAGADERARHALVIPCVPGQVKARRKVPTRLGCLFR